PDRLFLSGFGIVVIIVRIKRGVIGIRRTAHFSDARYAGAAWRSAAGVIKQRKIAALHLIAHEVTGLVISHAAPARSAVAFEVINGVTIRFALDQPELLCAHDSICAVKTALLRCRRIAQCIASLICGIGDTGRLAFIEEPLPSVAPGASRAD